MLKKLEDALRGALEGPFARFFPEKLQPLEIAAALRQALDGARLITADSIFSANTYTAQLHPADHEVLAELVPAVEREMAGHLLEYAEAENVRVGEAVGVRIVPQDGVGRGSIKVQAEFGAPPDAVIVVESGERAGKRHEFTERVLLGRGGDCDLVITDPAISRHHAEIAWEYVEYWLKDLKSANGSFINSVQVDRSPLRDGDLVEIGLTQLRLRTKTGTALR